MAKIVSLTLGTHEARIASEAVDGLPATAVEDAPEGEDLDLGDTTSTLNELLTALRAAGILAE